MSESVNKKTGTKFEIRGLGEAEYRLMEGTDNLYRVLAVGEEEFLVNIEPLSERNIAKVQQAASAWYTWYYDAEEMKILTETAVQYLEQRGGEVTTESVGRLAQAAFDENLHPEKVVFSYSSSEVTQTKDGRLVVNGEMHKQGEQIPYKNQHFHLYNALTRFREVMPPEKGSLEEAIENLKEIADNTPKETRGTDLEDGTEHSELKDWIERLEDMRWQGFASPDGSMDKPVPVHERIINDNERMVQAKSTLYQITEEIEQERDRLARFHDNDEMQKAKTALGNVADTLFGVLGKGLENEFSKSNNDLSRG